MKSSRSLGLCIAASLLLAGCYKATFYQTKSAVRGEEHDVWTDFFIFGLVGTASYDVKEFCGGADPAEVRTGGNFATTLVSAITLGIYAPRKVYVACNTFRGVRSSRELELALDSDGKPVRAILRDGEHTALARVTPAEGSAFAVRVEREVPR
jgi:Bor protein